MIKMMKLFLLIVNVIFVQCQYPPEEGRGLDSKGTAGVTPPPFLPGVNQGPVPPSQRFVCQAPSTQSMKAVVIINPDAGNVTGTLTFEQSDENSPVIIKGKLEKCLPAGLHGFHVHQAGDMRKACTSAGSHFNPNNVTHAAPEDQKRHVGDLGNIRANENGVVDIDLTDHVISLTGSCSVIGRALVVHLKPDDLGKGGDQESLKTGNAGSRIGCGVIGWA